MTAQLLTLGAKTQSKTAWAKELGITITALTARLKSGVPLSVALTRTKRPSAESEALTFDGITQPISEWALDYGITAALIRRRLRTGWSARRAVTTPMRVTPGMTLPIRSEKKLPS